MLDLANLHGWAQLNLKGFYGWFASKLFLYKDLYSTSTVKCVGIILLTFLLSYSQYLILALQYFSSSIYSITDGNLPHIINCAR